MRLFLLCLLLISTVSLAQPQNLASAIGYWKTIDDATGEVKSIVKITQTNDNGLTARIVKLFKDPSRRCTACEGDKKDQPILGMEVMKGLQPSKDVAQAWDSGSILDPKNGKTYHCQIHLADGGRHLNVRGFIGLPLFGRTQTWVRVKDVAF